MALQRSDFASATWHRLVEELQERLAALRAMNDAPADPVATATIRGRIAEVKRILDLAKAASSEQGGSPNLPLVDLEGLG